MELPHTEAKSFNIWNVVSVLVMVLAESIGQYGFRYWKKTKIVVSVVHYLKERDRG